MEHLFLALLVAGASAVQSQGLHWEFEKGKQYYFAVRVQNLEKTELSEMNLMYICRDYPSIQDPPTNNSGPPMAPFHAYYTDGIPTENYQMKAGMIAVPIGNWSLLSRVFEDYYMNDSIRLNETQSFRADENNEEWGFIVELSDSVSTENYTYQYSYSKQDGVLDSFYQNYYLSGIKQLSCAFTRLPLSPQLQSILTAGLALGIVVMVIIGYARFRKH